MKTYLGIGTMSGTSLDGLDLVAVQFTCPEADSYQFEIVATAQVEFDERWQRRLMNLPEQSAETYAKTHVYFGHWLGKQTQAFLEQENLQPDFVAMHGHTIFHQPDKTFTAQIGDGETIASYLTCPLITNFRNKDVAIGGEGAPLVPLGEQYLFPQYELFLNLGGFANVAWRGKGFDICSCNGVLNFLFQRAFPEADTQYDPGGAVARQGQLLPELLEELNRIPFYEQTPPKSLGWEWVEAEILPRLAQAEAQVEDLLHTCVVHAAQQIAQSIEREGIRDTQLLATGGGRHNTFLMEQLLPRLAERGISLAEAEDADWVDYKEAIVFAFLGLRCLEGKPTIRPDTTGAREAAVTGSIHLPVNGQGLARFFD